jgi:hypothetical protein
MLVIPMIQKTIIKLTNIIVLPLGKNSKPPSPSNNKKVGYNTKSPHKKPTKILALAFSMLNLGVVIPEVCGFSNFIGSYSFIVQYL